MITFLIHVKWRRMIKSIYRMHDTSFHYKKWQKKHNNDIFTSAHVEKATIHTCYVISGNTYENTRIKCLFRGFTNRYKIQQYLWTLQNPVWSCWTDCYIWHSSCHMLDIFLVCIRCHSICTCFGVFLWFFCILCAMALLYALFWQHQVL